MSDGGAAVNGKVYAPDDLIVFTMAELVHAPGERACAACGICEFPEGVPPSDALCPLSACPKGILNGPCGGMENGRCEVYPDRVCAHMYIRLRVIESKKLLPAIIPPREWRLEERRLGRG